MFENRHENEMMREIIDLVSNCGWVLEFEKREEHKSRFRNDYTFFDIWYGKKQRIVVGMFNPERGKMKWHYPADLLELEKLITK